MKAKPMPATAEIICSFTTVRTAPLSPFVWALLKALAIFKVEERPEFEELATKLCVGESSFLSEGWAEVRGHNLADDDHYAVAEITDRGEKALKDGFIRTGEPRYRTGEVLYFRLRDGEPINWRKDFEAKNHSKLFHPKWADTLDEDRIRNALEKQRLSSDERLEPNEKIYDLEFHWEDSSCVKLD